jgi:hypothetical protein
MSNHLTEEQIQSYLDKKDSMNSIGIEKHLENCVPCQKNLEEYRNLYSALNTDLFSGLPKDFSAKVVAAVSEPQESRWQLFESGFTIAFFLFGIAASLYFFNPLPFLGNIASNIFNNLGGYASKFLPELNGNTPIFIVAILIFLLFEIIDKKILRSRF